MKLFLTLFLFLFIGPPKKNCGRIVDHGNTEDGWYYFIEVENDSTHNKRKFIIDDKEFFSLNLQNPFCVDSLEYW